MPNDNHKDITISDNSNGNSDNDNSCDNVDYVIIVIIDIIIISMMMMMVIIVMMMLMMMMTVMMIIVGIIFTKSTVATLPPPHILHPSPPPVFRSEMASLATYQSEEMVGPGGVRYPSSSLRYSPPLSLSESTPTHTEHTEGTPSFTASSPSCSSDVLGTGLASLPWGGIYGWLTCFRPSGPSCGVCRRRRRRGGTLWCHCCGRLSRHSVLLVLLEWLSCW